MKTYLKTMAIFILISLVAGGFTYYSCNTKSKIENALSEAVSANIAKP